MMLLNLVNISLLCVEEVYLNVFQESFVEEFLEVVFLKKSFHYLPNSAEDRH